jgi:hypothetical protein
MVKMKSFRLRIFISWLCYAIAIRMIFSDFIIPLFVVCLLAPVGLRYLIKPIFPKRKFSKPLGWAMFLTIVVTILYCRWLQFSDSSWPIFVDGLLVAFGMFLVFTAYHDIRLWMTEFVNITFKELVGRMRKSPPYLFSIYVIVLPSIGFSWFFSSHGYYEIHIVPTTVRFKSPLNIDYYRCLVIGELVEAEKEPVKWAFSQKA